MFYLNNCLTTVILGGRDHKQNELCHNQPIKEFWLASTEFKFCLLKSFGNGGGKSRWDHMPFRLP